jgi:hypothetical protein
VTESDRFQDHGTPCRRATSGARVRGGLFRRLAMTLRTLCRRWVGARRRYRPERHYMRGGRRDGAATAAAGSGGQGR